jgi:putative transposase
MILFGEESLRKTLAKYISHFHQERNHQGKENLLLFPDPRLIAKKGKIKCREWLNRMIKYYYRSAA